MGVELVKLELVVELYLSCVFLAIVGVAATG